MTSNIHSLYSLGKTDERALWSLSPTSILFGASDLAITKVNGSWYVTSPTSKTFTATNGSNPITGTVSVGADMTSRIEEIISDALTESISQSSPSDAAYISFYPLGSYTPVISNNGPNGTCLLSLPVHVKCVEYWGEILGEPTYVDLADATYTYSLNLSSVYQQGYSDALSNNIINNIDVSVLNDGWSQGSYYSATVNGNTVYRIPITATAKAWEVLDSSHYKTATGLYYVDVTDVYTAGYNNGYNAGVPTFDVTFENSGIVHNSSTGLYYVRDIVKVYKDSEIWHTRTNEIDVSDMYQRGYYAGYTDGSNSGTGTGTGTGTTSIHVTPSIVYPTRINGYTVSPYTITKTGSGDNAVVKVGCSINTKAYTNYGTSDQSLIYDYTARYVYDERFSTEVYKLGLSDGRVEGAQGTYGTFTSSLQMTGLSNDGSTALGATYNSTYHHYDFKAEARALLDNSIVATAIDTYHINPVGAYQAALDECTASLSGNTLTLSLVNPIYNTSHTTVTATQTLTATKTVSSGSGSGSSGSGSTTPNVTGVDVTLSARLNREDFGTSSSGTSYVSPSGVYWTNTASVVVYGGSSGGSIFSDNVSVNIPTSNINGNHVVRSVNVTKIERIQDIGGYQWYVTISFNGYTRRAQVTNVDLNG